MSATPNIRNLSLVLIALITTNCNLLFSEDSDSQIYGARFVKAPPSFYEDHLKRFGPEGTYSMADERTTLDMYYSYVSKDPLKIEYWQGDMGEAGKGLRAVSDATFFMSKQYEFDPYQPVQIWHTDTIFDSQVPDVFFSPPIEWDLNDTVYLGLLKMEYVPLPLDSSVSQNPGAYQKKVSLITACRDSDKWEPFMISYVEPENYPSKGISTALIHEGDGGAAASNRSGSDSHGGAGGTNRADSDQVKGNGAMDSGG